MKNRNKLILFFSVIALSVIADQLTKNIAVKALENKGFVKVIGDFFGFELVRNPGAFLGLFSANRWLFMMPSAAAIVFLTVWLFKKTKAGPLFCVSISLFVGGGIGNMIDRLSLGKVIDFIAFRFGAWRFPNFNVADSCVTVGAALFLIYCLITDDKELFSFGSKKKKSDPDEGEPDGPEPENSEGDVSEAAGENK
ncbi:MAG: signal peptidase II [Clostridia bacterium]|nr:signal peptidase II [Clostridia bacterium]